MYLFLCLLFPIGFLIWCRVQGKEMFPKFLLSAFLGFFPAALFCAYKFFFSPFYYLPQDSFLLNFFYLFLNQIFTPLLILTFAFMLIDNKDSVVERFENIFPFFAGFYMVFLPFKILCESLPFPFFLLFAKPLIYFFMILAVWKIFTLFFANKKKIVRIFALLFVLIFPAVIESLWLLGTANIVIAAFVIIYLVLCFAISVSKQK